MAGEELSRFPGGKEGLNPRGDQADGLRALAAGCSVDGAPSGWVDEKVREMLQPGEGWESPEEQSLLVRVIEAFPEAVQKALVAFLSTTRKRIEEVVDVLDNKCVLEGTMEKYLLRLYMEESLATYLQKHGKITWRQARVFLEQEMGGLFSKEILVKAFESVAGEVLFVEQEVQDTLNRDRKPNPGVTPQCWDVGTSCDEGVVPLEYNGDPLHDLMVDQAA